MSLQNDLIKLDTFQAPLVNDTNLQLAWEELSSNSVECILAGNPGAWDFADNNCLYICAIQHLFHSKANKPERRRLFGGDEEEEEETSGEETMGIAYLTSSHLSGAVNIGIALLPQARYFGFGKQVVWLIVNWAFSELRCHRVQAHVLDGDPDMRDTSLGLFMGLGFSHEGTSRRAVFYATALTDDFPREAVGEWRDVINLAVLDMDWNWIKELRVPREVVKSRWDDLFARQERERQEMLRLEERAERGAKPEKAAGAVLAESSADFWQLENVWETSSQISSSSNDTSTDGDSQKGKERALADALATPYRSDHMDPLADNKRSSTPVPQRDDFSTSNASVAAWNDNVPIVNLQHRRPYSVDDSWETSSEFSSTSSTSSAQRILSDFDASPFSDAEEVPRSPSVASTRSRSSGWDLLETTSVESLDVAGLTDEE